MRRIGLFRAQHPFLLSRKVKADTTEYEQPGRIMLCPGPGEAKVGHPPEGLKTEYTPPVGNGFSAIADNEFSFAMRLCDLQNNPIARFEQIARVSFGRAVSSAMKSIKFSHHIPNARNVSDVEASP